MSLHSRTKGAKGKECVDRLGDAILGKKIWNENAYSTVWMLHGSDRDVLWMYIITWREAMQVSMRHQRAALKRVEEASYYTKSFLLSEKTYQTFSLKWNWSRLRIRRPSLIVILKLVMEKPSKHYLLASYAAQPALLVCHAFRCPVMYSRIMQTFRRFVSFLLYVRYSAGDNFL